MTNTFTGTVGNAPPRKLSYKERMAIEREQRRLKRIKDWRDKAIARSQKWLEDEIKKIQEDEKANEWRPRVSSKKGANDLCLNYWSLGRYNEDSDFPPGAPTWRTYSRRYDAKWLGITISNISPYELNKIKAFLKTLSKKDYLDEIMYECDAISDIFGVISHTCAPVDKSYWFRNLNDHNNFVDMLDAFPMRTEIIELQKDSDIEPLARILQPYNHMILVGRKSGEIVKGNRHGTAIRY